jgi:hypothetical protein
MTVYDVFQNGELGCTTNGNVVLISKLCRIYCQILMKDPPRGCKNDLYEAMVTIANNFVKNTTQMRILMRVEGKIFQIRSGSGQLAQIPRK